ncbi:DUF2935 domain-containing protein [Inconstantimicrobium mannanitabidum]|uniref:Uncharacterized protein n=1 Tax=Inconstantimicrobium mannanitabidum TaxID=1604901 RepID=A0ACB5R9N0_9CLOT|nr:DUF2935 domain-containing protein [Clostridium sp. TW13]GKX65887.1 hypothetical protein rsdtw13_11450 [Clostridium sp. TW13]
MITKPKFINQSLEINLFFLRIMKEHSLFLEAAFGIKDKELITEADKFKNEFTKLLLQAITISDGVIPSHVLSANEIVTNYTADAEKATEFYTGIDIDTNLTALEKSLTPATGAIPKNLSRLTEDVYSLNHRSISATNALIRFKTKLLNDVLSCSVYTTAYPLLIDHILREAKLFVSLLTKLQNGTEIDMKNDVLDLESFWNRIMSEHSYFIRGLLDPTEEELFNIANNFGNEFAVLTKEASAINKASLDMSNLTNKTLNKTIKLRDFKTQGTEGLLSCKIKSIIVPLLGDHVLREANQYIHLLKLFQAL